MASRILELHLPIELVDENGAVLPKERNEPVTILITPSINYRTVDGHPVSEIDFRVAFEPENPERRQQPLRLELAERFPNGWKHGDAWPGNDW